MIGIISYGCICSSSPHMFDVCLSVCLSVHHHRRYKTQWVCSTSSKVGPCPVWRSGSPTSLEEERSSSQRSLINPFLPQQQQEEGGEQGSSPGMKGPCMHVYVCLQTTAATTLMGHIHLWSCLGIRLTFCLHVGLLSANSVIYTVSIEINIAIAGMHVPTESFPVKLKLHDILYTNLI